MQFQRPQDRCWFAVYMYWCDTGVITGVILVSCLMQPNNTRSLLCTQIFKHLSNRSLASCLVVKIQKLLWVGNKLPIFGESRAVRIYFIWMTSNILEVQVIALDTIHSLDIYLHCHKAILTQLEWNMAGWNAVTLSYFVTVLALHFSFMTFILHSDKNQLVIVGLCPK